MEFEFHFGLQDGSPEQSVSRLAWESPIVFIQIAEKRRELPNQVRAYIEDCCGLSVESVSLVTHGLVGYPTSCQGRPCSSLQRFKIFDDVMNLLVTQTQAKEAVVVLDHIVERGKAPIMEEAALGMCPQSF